MPEHYSKQTRQSKIYCNVCNKLAMHRIDNGRKGPCLEHCADGLSTAQRRQRESREFDSQQPTLFDKPACNHLPVDKREFIDGALICTMCRAILREKVKPDV